MSVPTASLVRREGGLDSILRMAVTRLARRLRLERDADLDLSLSQLSVLGTLDRHGGMTVGELAAHEKVQPPSMTRTVTGLVGVGLVARRADPTDGRRVAVALSEAGRQVLAEDRRRRDAWLARRLRELGPDERDALRRAVPILERLAQT
jgi:DNA-binding MarR family transcriptional regulator